MENKDLQFAVGIKQPTKEILDVLKDVDLYDIDDGKAFVFKENDADIYDDLADHVADEDAVNTHVVFGILNVKDYNFFERSEIEDVVRESEELSKEDMLTLEIIPDLDPSDDELKKAIDESIKEINFQFYGGVEKSENHSPETSTDDKEESKNTESEVQVEETVEENKPENDSTTLEENSPAQEPAQENEEEPESAEEQNNNDVISENQAQEAYDEAEIDPLLKYSAKRFRNESKAELPMYDEVTTKQILPAFLNSETVMSNEQDNAIFRIYDKLQAARPQIEREFDEKFDAENKENHERTIQTLKDNEEKELTDLVTKHENDYATDRQKYVDSQKNVLEAQFDKEHKADYDFNLEHEKEMIRQKYESEIEAENDRYEEFRAEEEEKYLEAQLGKVDIDEILEDFENENKRQISIIKNEAKKFSDQVAVATEKISADRDEWKQKAAEAENKAKTLDETYEKRVAVDVKNGVDEQTRDLKAELASTKEQLSDSAEKMQDLGKKHADEISRQATQHEAEMHQMRHDAEIDKQKALEKQKAESDAKLNKLQSEYDAFKKQAKAEKVLLEKENKNIKDENAMQHSLISTLQDRENKLKAAAENQPEQVIRTVKPASIPEQQSSMPSRQTAPKMSKGVKWLISGLAVLALGGTGFSIYEIGSHSAANSQPQTSVSTTVQSQEQSAPYAKGDKVPYTDKNGNKHEVTITSVSGDKSIGYYTDGGNRYQVTFNN